MKGPLRKSFVGTHTHSLVRGPPVLCYSIETLLMCFHTSTEHVPSNPYVCSLHQPPLLSVSAISLLFSSYFLCLLRESAFLTQIPILTRLLLPIQLACYSGGRGQDGKNEMDYWFSLV